jgi:hypothetical protein
MYFVIIELQRAALSGAASWAAFIEAVQVFIRIRRLAAGHLLATHHFAGHRKGASHC